MQRGEDRARDADKDTRAQGVVHVQGSGVAALLGRTGQAHRRQGSTGRSKSHAETAENPANPDQDVRKRRQECDKPDQCYPDCDRPAAQRDQPVAPDAQPRSRLQPGTGSPADGANGQHRPCLQQGNTSLLDQHQRNESFSAEECAGEQTSGLDDLTQSTPKPQESGWHKRWQRNQKGGDAADHQADHEADRKPIQTLTRKLQHRRSHGEQPSSPHGRRS